jgi:single-stranded DNA-binding protein
MVHLNECYLAGVLSADPDVVQEGTAPMCTTGCLLIQEERDGQVYKTYIPIEAWGKAAPVLAALHEGDAVLLRGKLRWRSREQHGQKQGSVIVAAWSVQPLVQVAAAVAED